MAGKILIVDDSVVYRTLLTEIVSGMRNVESVATAPNGLIALKKLAQTPCDVVLLDVAMPEMDGIETLRKIRQDFPHAAVIMVSGLSDQSASLTIEALKIGAMEFICKPTGASHEENAEKLRREIGRVFDLLAARRLARAVAGKGGCGAQPGEVSRPPAGANAPVPSKFGLVVIGISTGGPNALAQVIPRLPAGYPLPVLIVQHMPPVFTAALASDLGRKSALEVVEAAEGMPIVPGRVIIAKGGSHMIIRRHESGKIVALNDGPPENSCRPAADVLFRSAADIYGGGLLSVVMTGMGCDGLSGVRAMKRKGCFCLTQSEKTCVVYGMPRAIDEEKLSDESVDLEQIADKLIHLAR